MLGVHEILGGLVFVAFLLLMIVNFLRWRGSTIAFAKPLSFAASGLLLLQYVIGFNLLTNPNGMPAIHYILALAAIIPVGAEHALANSQTDSKVAGKKALIANLVTVVIVGVTYQIGMNRGM